MNKKQQALVTLLQDVITLFESNRVIWESKIPVTDAFNKFRTIAEQFKVIDVNQKEQDTKGYTIQIKQFKQQLVDLAYNLTLKIAAYARFHSDVILLESVNISRTELSKLTAQNLISQSQVIHAHALKVKSASADYDISSEDLEKLTWLIHKLSETSTERNVVSNTRVVVTAKINKLQKECISLLTILDKVVVGFIKDETFVNTYHQARKVDDVTSRKKVKVIAA